MMKVVFEDGRVGICDNINKIYIEEIDWEKKVLVGSIEDCKDLRNGQPEEVGIECQR